MSNKTWQRVTSPYRITQCYLPPDRGDIPAFTPAEAGTRLSDPRGMQGWVDVVGLLHTTCTPSHGHYCLQWVCNCKSPSKVVPFRAGIVAFGPTQVSPTNGRAQHCARRVDYGACDMCRNRPHLRITSGLCGRIDPDSNTICNKTVLTCTPDL